MGHVWTGTFAFAYAASLPQCAHAALVVYDITDKNSFLIAQSWVRELQGANASIVTALMGNKLDLALLRSVEYNEAESYAIENNLLFMETSAKTATNVSELFTVIAMRLSKPNDQNAGSSGINRFSIFAGHRFLVFK